MNIWGIRKYGYIIFYILLVVVLYATMNGNKRRIF